MARSRRPAHEPGWEDAQGVECELRPVALAAWEVRSSSFGHTQARWEQVADAIACWPGSPVSLERRFVGRGRGRPLRELLLLAADGADIVADADDLVADLERLSASVRSLARMSRAGAVKARDSSAAGWACDVAELGRSAEPCGEDQPVALDTVLGALASLDHPASLSILVSSPSPLAADPRALGSAALRIPGGGLATAELPLAIIRRGLRFRLRLAGAEPLPSSLLALAGALVLRPGERADEAWTRARGEAAMRRALAAIASCSAEEWGGEEGTDELSSSAAAASLLAAPVDPHRFARKALAMPALRRSPPRQGALVGRAPLRSGRMARLRLSWASRHAHAFIAGSSGAGKSTFLSQLIADDVGSEERGLIVIDPHGDLARLTLGLLPAARRERTVLVDPAEPHTAGIDLVPSDRASDPAQVATRLADAFEEIYNADGEEYVGPWFHEVIQSAASALLSSASIDRPVTIADICRLVTSERFRGEVIRGLPRKSPLRGYWASYEARISSPYNRGDVSYVSSKLTALSEGPAASLLARPPRYALEELVADGGVLVCRLPIGELGSRTCRIVGRLLLTRLMIALAAQGSRPEAERRGVSVVIDEAQYFAGGRALEALLATTRKFGAVVSLATTAPSQFEPRALESALTNCATVAAFRLPETQARLLRGRTEGAESLLPTLPNFHFVLLSQEIRTDAGPAVVEGAPPLAPDASAAELARQASIERYGFSPKPDPPEASAGAGDGGAEAEEGGPDALLDEANASFDQLPAEYKGAAWQVTDHLTRWLRAEPEEERPGLEELTDVERLFWVRAFLSLGAFERGLLRRRSGPRAARWTVLREVVRAILRHILETPATGDDE